MTGGAEPQHRPQGGNQHAGRLEASAHHFILIERHELPTSVSRSAGIAEQLFYACQAWPEAEFRAAIVVERPASVLSGLRKSWLKHLRHLASERASTLDKRRQAALTRHMDVMERMQFVVGMPSGNERGVFLVEPAKLDEIVDVMGGTGGEVEPRRA